MDKIYCVISHTHWDREWYQTFEEFRLRLVDLIDHVLLILEQYPNYIFHLDAQTIVIDDYLAIRPQKVELLKSYISSGNLIIGPWYLQNDFFLASGESTIRNLLFGTEMASDLGKCSMVGYAPDQFGIISQLPQILKQFGIDNLVFGRGLVSVFGNQKEQEKIPSEFLWKGADDTAILAINMRYWYNNAQRFSRDIDKSLALIKKIERSFEGVALTPYILLMNGVDHLEAQEDLLPVLENINNIIHPQQHIEQISLYDYVNKVRHYLKNAQVEMVEITGELRQGSHYDILNGTLSSRTYLKRLNMLAQNILELELEPLYTMLELCGAKDIYSIDHFNYLWKSLLVNHPHDSICGCSRDEVHKDMENRFARFFQVANKLKQQGLEQAALHIKSEMLEFDDYIILIVNTFNEIVSSVVEATIDIPCDEHVEAFEIIDESGSVEFTLLSHITTKRDIITPINLPGIMDIDRYKVSFFVNKIKPISARVLKIVKTNTFAKSNIKNNQDNSFTLQNEYIKVDVSENGTINMIDLETLKSYTKILEIDDIGEIGDAYVHRTPQGDSYILSNQFKPMILKQEVSSFKQSIELVFDMLIPEKIDEATRVRSMKIINQKVVLTLELSKGQRWLNIKYRIENQASDHKMNIRINPGFKTDITYSSTPFDVISRNRKDVNEDILRGFHPTNSFICIQEDGKGLAVLTNGTYDYEHLKNEDNSIAITVLRCTDAIFRNNDGSISDSWYIPENQCLRTIEGQIAILPYNGDYIQANIAGNAWKYRAPLMVHATNTNAKKFAGGNFAVQDSDVAELFYREDYYTNCNLYSNQSVISVKGEGIIFSALKKAQNGKSYIMRLYNLSSEEKKATIELDKGYQLFYCNLAEEKSQEILDGEILFNKKQIKSIMIEKINKEV
jgi:alpha-mannosidase